MVPRLVVCAQCMVPDPSIERKLHKNIPSTRKLGKFANIKAIYQECAFIDVVHTRRRRLTYCGFAESALSSSSIQSAPFALAQYNLICSDASVCWQWYTYTCTEPGLPVRCDATALRNEIISPCALCRVQQTQSIICRASVFVCLAATDAERTHLWSQMGSRARGDTSASARILIHYTHLSPSGYMVQCILCMKARKMVNNTV